MKSFILILCVLGISEIASAQWTTSGSNIYSSNAGNAGIGTMSPSTKLDVYGGLRLRQTGNTPYSGSLLEMSDRNDSWAMGLHWNNYYDGSWKYRNSDYAGCLALGVNGDIVITNSPLGTANARLTFNERFRITNDGNVGIGTTTPSEKLAVNGKIVAKEVKVTLTSDSWPDYVFLPHYKLPDLKETEQFIKENKHLPEIPSAKEVAADGINLGEMNAKLLQKIEELTLYLIEKNKQLNEEKKINEFQEKRLKVIEKKLDLSQK